MEMEKGEERAEKERKEKKRSSAEQNREVEKPRELWKRKPRN